MTHPPAKHTPCTVGFVSLGCAKNLVDSQIAAGCLLTEGLRMVAPEEADIVFINTCGFIESARRETRETVHAVCDLKKSGRCRAVFVIGCYAQRYRRQLRREFPEVDGFAGLDALDRAGDLIRQWQNGTEVAWDMPTASARLYDPTLPGLRFAGGPYAYLKIAEGCHHRCRYCAIPLIRGNYRSRPLAALVAEAESLIAAGVREINLVSQDCMAYGRDLVAGRKMNPLLPELLRELDRLAGDFRIRVLYGSIHRVGSELIETIDASARICRYLDLPIQHSHPDILRAMGRGATARDLPGVVRRLRQTLPGLVLRTTCMTGFPGESESHFEHLLNFVREMQFDHLGVFCYSPEKGTAAARMPHDVPAALAAERRARLLKAQRRIAARRNDALRNSVERILLEQPATDNAQIWSGRSYREAPTVDGVVRVEGVPRNQRAGDWILARYSGRRGYDRTAQYERSPAIRRGGN